MIAIHLPPVSHPRDAAWGSAGGVPDANQRASRILMRMAPFNLAAPLPTE